MVRRRHAVKCNRTGHKAAECKHTVCFNCDGLGHVSKECVRPMYCCICKSGQHLARTCPLSWHRVKEDPPEQQPESQDATSVYSASDDRGAANDRDVSADRGEAETVPDDDEDIVIADECEESCLSTGGLADDDGTVHENDLATDINVSDICEVSQPDVSLTDHTPLPPSTPTLEPDVSDAEGSHVSAHFSTTDLSAVVEKEPARVTLDKEGFIVETVECAQEKSIPNPPVRPSTPSTERSWAEVVDLSALPIIPTPSTASRLTTPGSSAPKPQRSGLPRRKPAPSSVAMSALARKPTQPSRIPASKRMTDKNKGKKPLDDNSQEDMDISGGTRKRKKDLEEFGDREGKHPTT